MRICHTKYENTTNKFVSRLEGNPLQDHPKKEVIKIEKNKRLICRVSEKEYEKFEKLVEKSKLTKSEFMRKSILKKKIIVIEDIKDLTIELRRIGNNLNQLTRAVNSGEVKEIKELKEIKENLSITFDEVIKALEKVNK